MKIRAKMILSTAAVALSCALLAGCGGSSSSSAPAASSQAASSVASSAVSEAASATAEGTNGTDALDDAVNTLLDTNPISNQFEIASRATITATPASCWSSRPPRARPRTSWTR